jgi:hypothetical protein
MMNKSWPGSAQIIQLAPIATRTLRHPYPHLSAVLDHPLRVTSVSSAGILGCDRVLLFSVGLAPACHHDLTIGPAKPSLADKVVNERICPVPLPGEPARQFRLECDD